MITKIAIYRQERPAPADDLRSAADRDQAARELRHWFEWPYEVEVEDTEAGTLNLYGAEAREFLRRFVAGCIDISDGI